MDPILGFLEEEIGRRRLLRRGLAGGAMLGASALLPAGCAGYPEPPAGLKALTAKEYAVLLAAFDTIIPKTRPEALSVAEARAPERMDAALAVARPEVLAQIKQLLLIFEHGTPMAGMFKRFTSLSAEDRHAYMESWERSGAAFRKAIFLALKKMACLSYYADDATWKLLEYDGPMKTREGAPGPIGVSTVAGGAASAAAPGPLTIEGA